MESGEDDIALILGRSLTSGSGSFIRPRGRENERVNGEIHGSRALDQHGGRDSEQKRGGGFGDSTGMSMDSQGAESSSMGFRPLFSQGESKGLSSAFGTDSGSRQQQLQQQQDMGGLYGTHRLSVKQKFGELSNGPLLMASTNGMSGSSPFHVHKKQRLSSGLSRSAPVPQETSGGSGVNGSVSLFGRGRGGMTLIDDSSKADEMGRPLASTGGSTASSGRTPGSGSNTGAAGSGAGGAAAQGQESMLMSVLNMAKKRLFWG